jgi:hypothetical protein
MINHTSMTSMLSGVSGGESEKNMNIEVAANIDAIARRRQLAHAYPHPATTSLNNSLLRMSVTSIKSPNMTLWLIKSFFSHRERRMRRIKVVLIQFVAVADDSEQW